ncbi:unnamed protein product [Malus baccata var. baccata]
MADGIISMLLDRLASTVYEYVDGEVRLVLDAKKDVEEFAGNLRAIQAVLEDAEQRQVKEAGVRIWLDRLKDISFQMVDVLDEWNTDMLRQQVEKQEREGEDVVVPEEEKKKKKVTFSVSSSCFCFRKAKEVIFRSKIASRIKDLNGRLTEIDEQSKRYGFQHTERGIQQLPERQKTSSFVVQSEVFGREKERDILITKLLSDGGEDRRGLLIIPILGMGGMGKTTLAQLVYNDDNVKAYFEKTVWVCVSPFDEFKIAKAICGDNAPNSNELDHVLQRMSTSIEGKRFLLVLDDVWTHDREKWEIFRAPLIKSGASGSKILVTTRKREVVDMMRAKNEMINLGGLSEEYCLSIFNRMAFDETEVEESKAFEDISRGIVKKCKGLPLAAKALGSLMYNKKTRREWLDVLNSKIWDREEVEQEVFQPLFLSYYDLAPAVKCCLLYCASFPKDYEFERDELINLWMAHDYLNSKGNKDEGEVGQAIFDNLVARSFFQDLEKDSVSGKITGCKMHDIVHDFVQSLTNNECLITKDVDSEIEALGEKVHHLTLTFRSKRGESLPLPPSNAYCNCKNLRSLSYLLGSSIAKIDSNFILRLKCLRTLNLSYNSISEVPKEIGELMHLRYIDLSGNDGLKILPDSICELYNLYTLILCYCRSLEKLPDNMGKLISLKHLYVVGCDKLEYLPKGIRRLKKLKRIDACVVVCGEDENRAALQVGDLRVLNHEGSLIIKLKGNVKDERELEKAQLWDMKKLFHLEIDSRHVQYKGTRSTVEILNGLRPHENLESLSILYHSGTTCPNWIMSLHNLRIIYLYEWSECQFLPPLGKLPHLEKLTLHVMDKVKKIGGEFLGIVDEDESSLKSSSSSSFFPKLKEFEICFMSTLEEWEVGVEGWNKEDSEISILPCLSSLEISDCKGIKTLPDFLWKTPLQELIIEGCPSLSERYKQDSGEERPKISHIPNIKIF